MKRLMALLISALFVSPHLFAQEVDDSLRFAESVWSMEKKAVILEEMDLTEAEKSAFWPVYDSYSNAIQYLDMEYIRLINYTPEHELSDRKASSLTENILLNEILLAKTRKQYYKKFSKALSPAQAGKFMQLDSDIRTMIRLKMQKNAPAMVSSLNRVDASN
ncbi:MAG TPA: hypothetical protein VFO54_06700 [Chryseosolibacter sp.]|nr:hypothetical protein [Chryseosolibacter sp.]